MPFDELTDLVGLTAYTAMEEPLPLRGTMTTTDTSSARLCSVLMETLASDHTLARILDALNASDVRPPADARWTELELVRTLEAIAPMPLKVPRRPGLSRRLGCRACAAFRWSRVAAGANAVRTRGVFC